MVKYFLSCQGMDLWIFWAVPAMWRQLVGVVGLVEPDGVGLLSYGYQTQALETGNCEIIQQLPSYWPAGPVKWKVQIATASTQIYIFQSVLQGNKDSCFLIEEHLHGELKTLWRPGVLVMRMLTCLCSLLLFCICSHPRFSPKYSMMIKCNHNVDPLFRIKTSFRELCFCSWQLSNSSTAAPLWIEVASKSQGLQLFFQFRSHLMPRNSLGFQLRWDACSDLSQEA